LSVAVALPKAEIHVHIEGTAKPALIRRLAARNGVRLGADLFTADDRFAWSDFPSFLRAYDAASAAIRKPIDLRDLVYDYLADCAREGAIYVEFFASLDHAAASGMDYAAMLEGMTIGIDDAARDFDIVARIVVVCLRHLGPDRASAVVRRIKETPHAHVVGFGMAGDETRYHPKDFAPAFRLARDLGLGCTAHAGEVAGPESVKAALDHLPLTRIGHGVRAIEDARLVDEIARKDIALEVCPGSNLSLGVFPDARSHPLRRLIDAGCRVTLNSDDPPFFDTSIGREYRRAAQDFGLDRKTLLGLTRNAVQSCFADTGMKTALIVRLAETEGGAL